MKYNLYSTGIVRKNKLSLRDIFVGMCFVSYNRWIEMESETGTLWSEGTNWGFMKN